MSAPDAPISLSAVRVIQPIGEFYLAVLSAWELSKIVFVDVRALQAEQDPRREVEKYLGIQRPLKEDRIKEIKQYIKGSDASFPTSVILAIDSKCVVWNEEKQVLTLKSYEANPEIPDSKSIPLNRIAQILDGQHRVVGLEDWKPGDGQFDIPVSIFVGADIATQATIFATVNLTQTKVNRSLVFDLSEFAETRSPQKTAHNIAVVLDGKAGSPFHHRIKRLGVATPGRATEPLTQATFVTSLLPYLSQDPVLDRQMLLRRESLEWPKPSIAAKCIFRTLFIQSRDDVITVALWNYFDAVRKRWPEAWDDFDRGALLPKTNGFRALMRLLRPIYWSLKKKPGEIATYEEVEVLLKKTRLEADKLNTSEFLPGTSGEAALFRRLMSDLELPTQPD